MTFRALMPDEHELHAVRAALLPFTALRLALVFGSVARHEAGPQSDVDVAVLARHRLTAQEHIALIEAVARHTGRPVDLVDLANTGHPLQGEILRDGVRVLGDAAAHAQWTTRALFDAADFYPYVKRLLAERRQRWIGP